MPGGAGPSTKNEPVSEAEQIEECCRLSALGLTQREIGRRVGISQTTVHDRIKKGYLQIIVPAVTELRKIEADKLQQQEQIAASIANDETADPELRLKALDRLGRISARRAALFGLDSPVKVEATVTHLSEAEQELQAILAQADRDNKAREASLRADRAAR